MNNALVIAQRALKQLKQDKRLLGLTVGAPLVIIYFLKLYMDTMPGYFPVDRYVMPIAAFLVFFLSFLLCVIVLVQERTGGTLERMFISGANRMSVIAGFPLCYLCLATISFVIVLAESLYLFELDYSYTVIAILFGVLWLLAVVSVMLGILISTFARNEAQLFPFIPLINVPSFFLSGLLVDVDLLPTWAQWVGMLSPLLYANNVIKEVIVSVDEFVDVWHNIPILMGYALVLLLIASQTLKEVE